MVKKEDISYNIKSGMMGLVVADALGVPYEFKSREYCEKHPMTDMVGYGTYKQAPGTWSDDSSLALASLEGLAQSINLKDYLRLDNSDNSDNLSENDLKIIEDIGLDKETLEIINFSKLVDYNNIMEKFYNYYMYDDYTPYDEVFDIGITTRVAILNFEDNPNGILCGGRSERDNGNGSLMRILPVAYFIYFLSLKYSFLEDEEMKIIHNLSSLTHGHPRSQMACGIYIKIAIELIKNNLNQEENLSLDELVNNGINLAKDYYLNNDEFKDEIKEFNRVFSSDIKNIPKDEISSKGYVVYSLEAALWCLFNSGSYRETALMAVNLGEDTDTNAAIAGGLAGLYYGLEEIPENWINQIAKLDYIYNLFDKYTEYMANNFE